MRQLNCLQIFDYEPFDPDNPNTYKTNANPKINNFMSKNIGQSRLNFSLKYSRQKFSLLSPIFSDMKLFIYLFMKFVLYFLTMAMRIAASGIFHSF